MPLWERVHPAMLLWERVHPAMLLWERVHPAMPLWERVHPAIALRTQARTHRCAANPRKKCRSALARDASSPGATLTSITAISPDRRALRQNQHPRHTPEYNGPIAQRLEQETHNLLVPGSNPGGPTIPRFKPTLLASQKAQQLRTAAGSCGSARGPAFPPSSAQKPEKCSLSRPHSLSPWSPESQEPSDEVIHTIKINHLRLVQEYELDGRRGWQVGVKLRRWVA